MSNTARRATREGVEAAMAAIVALQKRLQTTASTGWMKLDLTLPQVKVLMVLGGSGESGARMSELGRALGTSASTATGIVDRLAERALVERVREESDRRTVRVQLTQEGRETVAEIASLTNARMRVLLERLTTEELETVRRAMESLVGAAGREER